MPTLSEQFIGFLVLASFAAQALVKLTASGQGSCRIGMPRGHPIVVLTNAFNLVSLLIFYPLIGTLLVAGSVQIPRAVMSMDAPAPAAAVGIVGLGLHAVSHLWLGWALVALGRNYQLGGMPPREEDRLVTRGPYRLARHPVYSAALGIWLGLSLALLSWIPAAIFVLLLILVHLLIPIEEKMLANRYGNDWRGYCARVKKLVPHVY